MMFVRYGQAALIAAIMAMTGNAVWAQQPASQDSSATPGYINYFAPILKCCKDGKCCKEGESCSNCKKCAEKCTACKNGQCCKGGDCCCDSKKCDAKCTCNKDSKCACCKDGDCCCDKNGKCSCGKDDTSAKSDCGCCPFMNMLAKRTAIIMVMPASMPLPACCMEAMGMMPHPPMPPMPLPGPHVFLPPMMPPMPPIPPTPSMGIGTPVAMPPMPTCYGYAPCPDGSPVLVGGTPTVVPCSATPPDNAKVCIIAASSSDRDQLAMSIGEETSIRCKKMTIKIGDNEIRVSRFDDRVRVRGEELKATADCVRSDRKERLILEGDVVLRFKKDGKTRSYNGDRIELNLGSSIVNMTIQRAAKTPSTLAVPIPTP